MLLDVGVERGEAFEATPAVVARELQRAQTLGGEVFVRLVDLLVGVQRRSLDETLAADAAHVGALAGVGHLVALQVAAHGEALGANLALVGLLFGVRAHVLAQLAPSEGFVADLALVVSVLRVLGGLTVVAEIVFGGGGVVADVAFVLFGGFG